MKSTRFLLTVSVLTLVGCVHPKPAQTTYDPAHPERNSAGDPIVAVFEGRIPCAASGCAMRKVELVLYGRDAGRIPKSYWLGQVTVGKGSDRLVQQGAWTTRRGLQEYPDGLVYQLDSSADPSLQHLWRVNADIVLVLDQNLRPKAGNAAWGFMLSRDCTPYGPRTYAYDERMKRFVTPASTSNCVPLGTDS
jgi:hypothetical protein